MSLRRTSVLACAGLFGWAVACRPSPPAANESPPPASGNGANARAAEASGPAGPSDASLDALDALDASSDAAIQALARGDAAVLDAGSPADSDPMSLHKDTRDELLSLFSIKDFSNKEKAVIQADRFLHNVFGTDGPGHISQGNKAIASHTISKAKCLEGLRGVTLQTPEQRAKCGADNMVPVWIKGKAAWFCIDIFEFPNKPCELPVVWAPPSWDKKICELQGKRLCSDIEWNIACRGDPDGGPDQRYAYGETLDLSICNTNKGHTREGCSAHDAKTAWKTCSTETEPSGSFPKCKSRFGVYDQHGNVAEVMMRREGSQVFTQLKGSAWFYNELAKEPHEPVPATTPNKKGAYPDHCNFNPRWHVEPIDAAFHVNYHLGFRCCKSIP
jgi:hypothetical protein